MITPTAAPSGRQSQSAFTLIELLVVIAIIAILAAILFPVFASAREKARQAQCLSNVRQIGLSFAMYTQDYDETTLSVFGDGDWWVPLFPYFKSYDMLICPDRDDWGGVNVPTTPADFGIPCRPDGSCRIEGYGYNGGPLNTRGGGLLKVEGSIGTGSPSYTEEGKSINEIVSPANTFAFGDSYDTPRMGFAMTFLMCSFNGTDNEQLRHQGGHFSVAFVDGHAKSVYYEGGYMSPSAENHRYARPRDTSMISDYCANPDTIINNDPAPYNDGLPIPSGLRCGDIGTYFDQHFSAPCNGTVPSGGGCLWNN